MGCLRKRGVRAGEIGGLGVRGGEGAGGRGCMQGRGGGDESCRLPGGRHASYARGHLVGILQIMLRGSRHQGETCMASCLIS